LLQKYWVILRLAESRRGVIFNATSGATFLAKLKVPKEYDKSVEQR
jgi:hypothetical protein